MTSGRRYTEETEQVTDDRGLLRTFVISDIRGYSTFTRERGDETAARLAVTFADLANDVVEARGGEILGLRGDEFVAVFESPTQAVRAGLEFQQTCAEQSAANPDLPLPVGVGIDHGKAVAVEDGYRGRVLNLAARLCSEAAGGQILTTTAVAEACRDLDAVTFESRGEFELKGFDQPVEALEPVSTLEVAVVSEAPRTREQLAAELDSRTPLAGREHERRWLRGTWLQARRGRGRVVFISGPAGIGKTRLAAELSEHVRADGGSVRYACSGGVGAAQALAAISEADSATVPTLCVLDDLGLYPEAVAALADALEAIESRPALVVGLFRDARERPELAALSERADVRGDGHIELGPLDLDGVTDVARSYVGDVDEVPVQSMLRASQGVPARVHELVSEWARDEAKRRLEASAEYLAAGRDSRAAGLEFANNVIGLKLGRIYRAPEGRDGAEQCPYKGLASFEESDAPDFYGRERLVGELAARTVGTGLLGVVGPSGSGKSSVVMAGLLPSLSAGLLPGSERWDHVSMRPGDQPLNALETALAGRDRGERLVLVVDQFEELFAASVDDSERAAFIDRLVAAAGDPDDAVVVIAVRADYTGHLALHGELSSLFAANLVLVGPLTRDELKRAIELPARRAGVRVESDLSDALVAEVEAEPGGLPLLSTALVELWQARDDDWLRLEGYERTGGVRGAVARLAEASYEQLSPPEREAAKRVLLRLVGEGEGQAAVRRRVPVAEFDTDRDPVGAAVLSRLTEDRLLTRDDGMIEVAHEALIREWPRLRGWLDEDVKGRQLRAHLRQSAKQWAARDRDAADLYRGKRLSSTLDWARTHDRELNELEREFLARSRHSRRRRRGGVLVAFGGGLLIAAGVAAILAGGDAAQLAEANSLAVIDPASNSLVDTVPTGVDPADVSADADHVWVANRGDDNVTEVDPQTKAVVRTSSAHIKIGGLAAGAGGVWIGDSRRKELVRLDPDFPSAADSIPLARRSPASDVTPVAVGHGAVWVAGDAGTIARIDPERSKVDETIRAASTPSSIATGAGGVWTVDYLTNTAFRIDPAGAKSTEKTRVGLGPAAVAVGEGAVWVANTLDDTVTRIDPRAVKEEATIAVGSGPTGIAAGDGAVWVANSLDGTVSRIDPQTNEVEAEVEIGEAPQRVTIAHGQVWVSVQAGASAADAPSVAVGEDVARVVVPKDPGSPDPALYPLEWQARFATSASLYNYPDKPFPEGIRLQPEVAAGKPVVSDGGRTYRFEIRRGFRFSPPSNQPVTAEAFERALERALSPTMQEVPTAGYLVSDIVGAEDYSAGRTKTLEGVSARGRTLVIRLKRPVPSLPARLAKSQFSAVPPETRIKPEGVDLVASAGPYYVDSYLPGRGLVLRRNPNYGGERPQRLEEIRYEFRVSAQRGVEAVEAGRADYVNLSPDSSAPVHPEVVRQLAARYGPDSEGAQAGRQQFFTQTAPAVDAYIFNTHRGPFTDPRLRRAVNYAIDRPALAQDSAFGNTGRPTDQFIPPDFPGFEDAEIYPLDGPDLATARRLVGDERRDAVLYTCDFPGCIQNARTLRSNLDAIGIDLEVRRFPDSEIFKRIDEPAAQAPWDVASFGWIFDYGDPSDFITNAFGPPPSGWPGDFRDPGLWRRMAAADRLSGDARLRAFARLDRDLAQDAAPAAPFDSLIYNHFLSARMGCEVSHPLYGLDLAALCVRDDAEAD